HPDNAGFPQPWRVDGQLGVGPVRARLGDWKIEQGETETIKHRLYCHTGELNDAHMLDQWKDYIGGDGFYTDAALWGLAQEEGRNAKFLSPQEAVEEMSVQAGFAVNAWAAEPMITQPMAFCWDDRGRLWIAENRDYESRGHGFSKYGDSRILILEDTDRDGKADSRKVFLEGIPFPSAIAVGFDGLFLGAPPNLLFIPDRDQDDKADMDDIEVLLTGWGIRDRHETINSFHWGPDGWLYGLEGFATPSKIRKPVNGGRIYQQGEEFPEDLLDAEGVDIDGGVWRYHPIKDRFEVVAHGFSNPWGIDYDANGQLFITACVIPHMFHIMPGGIYQRQGGKHFNPYVYDDIKTIVDHRHRSAHGGARFYLSDAFPEAYQGQLFMANIHEHAVLSDILKVKGSGFVASHGHDFVKANNAQWIGFSMELGPDGSLYVLDWHDGDICGKEVLDKETGRVFRIAPKQSLADQWDLRYSDLKTLDDVALAQLQKSASSWHDRRARILLQSRAAKRAIDENAIALLHDMFQAGTIDVRLKALWTLHVINALETPQLLAGLEDQEEYVRAWCIQLLTEDGAPSRATLDRFVSMAKQDPSAVVRRYLAAALQRLQAVDRWAIVEHLCTHQEDQEDQNIPRMIWFGMESLVPTDVERAMSISTESNLSMISNFIARRAAATEPIEEVLATIDPKAKNVHHQLEGIRNALRDKSNLQTPDIWPDLAKELQKDMPDLVLEIGQMFGDAGASAALLRKLQNRQTPIDEKRAAIQALSKERFVALKPLLQDYVYDKELSSTAISAIGTFQDQDLASFLIDNLYDIEAPQRPVAIQALASNAPQANLLLEALRSEKIAKADIPQYSARQMRRVLGSGFLEFWGPLQEPPEGKQRDYEKYRTLLSADRIEASDLHAGAIVFEHSCANCHQLFGRGGLIGPDLTGANRTDVEYLLSNLIEPSGDIQDAYKMMVITKHDGQTIVGNLASESPSSIAMRVVGESQEVTIPISTIQSREVLDVSLMPEGLLRTLDDDEVLSLVKFLRYSDESNRLPDAE
ncbi:MAG: dehydrogenase, partial [Saprospiraceae bacterium]|nr:dehydrogenase [Saprospiraceae bacterium]